MSGEAGRVRETGRHFESPGKRPETGRHRRRSRGWLRSALALGLAVALPASAVAATAAETFPADAPETWKIEHADLYSVTARGSRVWAVGYWGTALRSLDGGASWEAAPTPTADTLYDVHFADERHGWAVGATGRILRSVDGGASWSPQAATVEDDLGERGRLDTHLFAVAALSDREAWAVGDMGIVIHVEDGETWRQVRIPEDVYRDDEPLDRIFNGIQFADSRHGWIVGEFGTILRTQDGGRSWTADAEIQGAPDELYLYDVAVLDAERAAAVGLAGSVLVTEDGGRTWQTRRTATSAPLYGLTWGNPRAAAVGDRGEIFATSDLGRSWFVPERPPIFNWLQSVASGEGAALYAVGERGTVLRSTDEGRSWRQLRGASPPPRLGVSVPEMSGISDPGLDRRRIPVTFDDGRR